MAIRSVQEILDAGGWIDCPTMRGTIPGKVYSDSGTYCGSVSSGFRHHFCVTYSTLLHRYFSHDLKDEIEMKYKLRKILKGE